MTLSSLIDRTVDLLKIDVEGAELPVIRELCGSGKIALVERMVIEFHHDPDRTSDGLPSLLDLLRTHGFQYSFAMGPTRFLMPLHGAQDMLVYTWRHGTPAGFR